MPRPVLRMFAGALAVVLAAALAGRPASAQHIHAPVIFLDGVAQESGLATLLRTETARSHDEMSAWFGVSLDRPVTVRWIVAGDDMERRTGVAAGGIAGAARPERNEILLYAPALVSRPERIAPVLRHEMSHLVFAKATSRAELEPPRWLDEGIAMWRSGEWDLDLAVRRDRSAWLRDASLAGHLFAFDDLDGRFPAGTLLPLAYAQSASFVDWLERRGGEGSTRRLIRELGRDADLDVALATAYGDSLSALESSWRKEVAPRGLLGRIPSEGVLASAVSGVLGILLVAAWVRKRRRLHELRDEDEPKPAGPSGPAEGSSSQNLASTPESDRG